MICEGVEEGVARELKYRLGDYRKCEGVETELKGNWEEERSLLTLFIKSLLPNYDRLKTFEQGKHLRFVPWAPPRLEPGQFI